MDYKYYISVNAILNSLGSLSLSSRRLSEFIIHGPEVTSLLSSMKSSERKNRKKGSRNRVRERRDNTGRDGHVGDEGESGRKTRAETS